MRKIFNNFNHFPNKFFRDNGDDDDDDDDDDDSLPRLDHSATAATKKIIKVPNFYRTATLHLIPRFLQSNNSSSQAAAGASASASSSILQPLLSRITPDVVGFLRRSTFEGEVEDDDDENGGGIISRFLRSRSGGGGGGNENGGGIISRFLRSRRGGGGASFHEPQKKILIAAGLPSPPDGRWFRITPHSLDSVKSLATRKEECKKAISDMDSISSAYLSGFSSIMITFVSYMDKMVLNCEHLISVGLIVSCAVAFELLLSYLAVSEMGNNFSKFTALKDEVLGLKVQMEQQLRGMEVDDYEDESNNGFQALITSCKLIIQPLGFSNKIVFQIMSLLLMVITIGFTINNVFIQWKKKC